MSHDRIRRWSENLLGEVGEHVVAVIAASTAAARGKAATSSSASGQIGIERVVRSGPLKANCYRLING
jgi:hypothetical protein